MRIYFSGSPNSGPEGISQFPEVLIPERKPHVMLTFHELFYGYSGERTKKKAEMVSGPAT